MQLTALCFANTTHSPCYTRTNKSGCGWSVHRCPWRTNIKHNHRLSGQFRPHSAVFPHGPVRTQVSSSQNLVVKVNLSERCKGGWKPVVKLLSEVSGMCLPAAARFNMAGSVCSLHRQDVFPFFSPYQTKVHLRTTLQIFRSLFQCFEKRETRMESNCKKKRSAKSEQDTE